MKKVKTYHVVKYNLTDFLDKFTPTPIEVKPKMSIDDVLTKSFGSEKLSYSEMGIKKRKLEQGFFKRNENRTSLLNKEMARNRINLISIYRDKALGLVTRKTLNMYNIVYKRVPIKVLRRNKTSLKTVDIVRNLDRDNKSNDFDIDKAINWDNLLCYVKTHYESKEEFLVDLMLSELQFLTAPSFLEVFEIVGVKLGLSLN